MAEDPKVVDRHTSSGPPLSAMDKELGLTRKDVLRQQGRRQASRSEVVKTPYEVTKEVEDLNRQLEAQLKEAGIIREARQADDNGMHFPGFVIAEKFRTDSRNLTTFDGGNYKLITDSRLEREGKPRGSQDLPEPFNLLGFTFQVGVRGKGLLMMIPHVGEDGKEAIEVVGITGNSFIDGGRSAGINTGRYDQPIPFRSLETLRESAQYQALASIVSAFEERKLAKDTLQAQQRGWIGNLRRALPSQDK
jgi:hypothetical protein